MEGEAVAVEAAEAEEETEEDEEEAKHLFSSKLVSSYV